MRKSFLILNLLISTIFVGFPMHLMAQEDKPLFTIYLIRHAEKDISKKAPGDPPLTKCGEKRAEMLSQFLNNVNIDAIYSTNYNRTLSTASPIAKSKNLEIQHYSAGDLESFAKILIEKKQDALVVGHSNTTGVLAGLLGEEAIEPFDESIYNFIFQVIITENETQINVFESGFECEE